MTANTSLNGVQIVEESKTEQISESSQALIKSYKLDPNTKTFSGNPGEKLAPWLFIIKDAFTAINVQSDQIKLSLVTNYVKGSAFTALMRYRKNADPTWTGFEDLLRAQFEDSNLDYKVRTQFFHLKMTDSFPKYLARFQELLNQMTIYSENDIEILYKFTDGLVKEYALAVRRDKCETLTEAIKVCQDIECLSNNYNTVNHGNESLNKVNKINFSKMNFKPNGMLNKYQAMKNRYTNNRYSKPMNSFGSNYLKQPSKNFSNKSNKKVDLNNITCYKCKLKGHYSSNCKENSSNLKTNFNKAKKVYSIDVYTEVNNETSLLNINGTINGIKVKMTLDSGATTCVLSDAFARKNNIKILNSDVLVKLAHNEVVKVLGVTEKLHVDVRGHSCDLEMFVLPNSDFECLLGLNWFLEMRVSISPADRTIKFQSEIFSLEDSDPLFNSDVDESLFLTNIESNNMEDVDKVTEWDSLPFTGIKPEVELNKNQLKKVAILSDKIVLGVNDPGR